MNLTALRYFRTIAKLKSFTRAAQQLRVSQPALSKMVRLLEEELETKLLDRTGRALTLTPSGHIALFHADKIFSEEQVLKETIQGEHAELQGEFGIGVSENIGIHLLPKPLCAFKKAHPKLGVHVFAGTSTDIKRELWEERIDYGVFFTPLRSHEPFTAVPLFETEFWIVLSPSLIRETKKKELTFSQFKKMDLPKIESRHRDYSGGFPAHFHSKDLGLTGKPYIEVNHHEIKLKLVLEGAGFSVLTRPTVEAEVKKGKLLRVETPQPLLSPVFGVMKKGRTETRAMVEFRKGLLDGVSIE